MLFLNFACETMYFILAIEISPFAFGSIVCQSFPGPTGTSGWFLSHFQWYEKTHLASLGSPQYLWYF